MKPDFKKDKNGLTPAIIQDADTNKVLMLGYMNDAAFEQTIKEKKVVFFSRSKQRLWMKGETSNNYLEVKEILADCDNDAILIKAKPAGPICHTGADTCFNEKNIPSNFLEQLENIIEERKSNPKQNSYTSRLFRNGVNSIAQKVGEEAVELVIESKDNNAEKFINEAADLLFHYMVLLSEKKKSLKDVVKVLEERHVV